MKTKVVKHSPNKRITRQHRKVIEAMASGLVDFGFLTNEQITDRTADAMNKDYGLADIKAIVAEAVEKAAARHLEMELTWNGITDCERLDAVEMVLESHEILLAQNLPCYEIEGAKFLTDLIADCYEDQNEYPIGCVYYVFGNTFAAIDGDGLSMTLTVNGKRDSSSFALTKVAVRVCEMLEAAGLVPKWSRYREDQIRIPKFTWQRRRSGITN